jgi:multiple sugar transport system permease protein
MSAARRREALQGYLYISLWIVGFVFFIAGPLIASLYYSFTYYPLLAQPSWVGLQNYETAFFKDRIFWLSSWRTLLWALTTVPLAPSLPRCFSIVRFRSRPCGASFSSCPR